MRALNWLVWSLRVPLALMTLYVVVPGLVSAVSWLSGATQVAFDWCVVNLAWVVALPRAFEPLYADSFGEHMTPVATGTLIVVYLFVLVFLSNWIDEKIPNKDSWIPWKNEEE